MTKLNVGCGGKIFPKDEGWINIDAHKADGVDLIMDINTDNMPYEERSIVHIHLQDVLEHLPEQRQDSFLKHCHSLLIKNGTLFIQVPDIEVIAKRYLKILENPTPLQHDLDAGQVSRVLYASGDIYDLHKWAYDQYSLKEKLESIGFTIDHIGSDGGSNLLCYARR